MIEDSLDNYRLYPFGKAWFAAFEFLQSLTPDAVTGKRVIQDTRLFAGVDVYETKSRDDAKLETHRKYIDIQTLLTGTEIMEVYPKHTLLVDEPYNPEREAEFYRTPSLAPVRITLIPGRFVVLFPEDAHKPCLNAGNTSQVVKKVVVKVARELLIPS